MAVSRGEEGRIVGFEGVSDEEPMVVRLNGYQKSS